MADLVAVAPGPLENWSRLADTVRHGRPATPIEDDPDAFYVPLVEGTFTTMWRCATRADLRIRYSATPAARILDLGAGGAPWAIAILTACPLGSAVINDSPRVLQVARRKATELGVGDRCEWRPGDYLADRDRARCLRPRRPRACVPCRRRRRRDPADRTCLRRAASRWTGHRRRLLLRSRAQAQPPRRADGRDDDGQHAARLHVHHRRVRRMDARRPGSAIYD